MVYSDSRYQRLADQDSSYAGFGGGLNLAVTETPGYSSSFLSQLAGYGINDKNHKFSYNEKVQLARGSNSVWKLSSGSSISVMPQLVLMRAIPNLPQQEKKADPPKRHGRSYVAAGISLSGTAPLGGPMVRHRVVEPVGHPLCPGGRKPFSHSTLASP